MKEQQISLKTTPIGRLMAHFGIPCVISLLVAALYNIADHNRNGKRNHRQRENDRVRSIAERAQIRRVGNKHLIGNVV